MTSIDQPPVDPDDIPPRSASLTLPDVRSIWGIDASSDYTRVSVDRQSMNRGTK
ncbi:hypothetical protein HDU93_006063, partial [Gonapodya sp. JEL0774]